MSDITSAIVSKVWGMCNPLRLLAGRFFLAIGSFIAVH